MRRLKAFLTNATGATSIEYALIATVISLSVIAGATAVGNKLNTHYFQPIANNLT